MTHPDQRVTLRNSQALQSEYVGVVIKVDWNSVEAVQARRSTNLLDLLFDLVLHEFAAMDLLLVLPILLVLLIPLVVLLLLLLLTFLVLIVIVVLIVLVLLHHSAFGILVVLVILILDDLLFDVFIVLYPLMLLLVVFVFVLVLLLLADALWQRFVAGHLGIGCLLPSETPIKQARTRADERYAHSRCTHNERACEVEQRVHVVHGWRLVFVQRGSENSCSPYSLCTRLCCCRLSPHWSQLWLAHSA